MPLEPVFAERDGWRRLYVDLPGSGCSPRLSGPVTAEAMGEAVLRFVDKVIGDEPFAVVVISYGGQLARHVVAERGTQVLGAALIAPLVKPSGEREVPEREVFTRDEALLESLDPADREVFAGIAVHQDETGLERVPRPRACPCRKSHPPWWGQVNRVCSCPPTSLDSALSRSRRSARHDDRSCCCDWPTWV
ncbi:alpha/beta fold hydrolase [Streptomyces sp. NPDC004647]|uniref:alpha/beta fold hydrolase n=1 Tax=Streptomyces sp. NPDC004647 TaxID=3154671 RepID=UPI0033AAB5C4